MAGIAFGNPVKDKLAAGGVALGLGVRMSRSAEIARIAHATGHDFLFIDVAYSYAPLGTVLTRLLGGAISDALILRSTNFIYTEPPLGPSANAPSGC